MENKKLLKFLLKDLSELDELFAEKNGSSFDELEMEFLITRVKGAKKLVQILFEREDNQQVTVNDEIEITEEEKNNNNSGLIEQVEKKEVEQELDKSIVEDVKPENKVDETIKDTSDAEVVEEKIAKQDVIDEPPVQEVIESREEEIEEVEKEIVEEKHQVEQKEEVKLEEEKVAEVSDQRLGDSFSKEKSVNDLVEDGSKLEHKLSNRPVSSIQTSIGINDRFQYIRELFDGNADSFSKTVTDIDAMNDINEAVKYLQQNFKWKKNETSLKFVNLVKRRFPNG